MRLKFIALIAAVAVSAAAVGSITAEDLSLTRIQQILAAKKMVDLTHAFEPGIPRWPGFPDEKRETAYWYEKGRGTMGEGFFSEIYTHVGQWGTHVDPPAHFIKGLRTVDQIELKEMILPLVLIDVHAEAAKNPDYTLTFEREKVGERSRPRSGGRVCGVANGLVEALARCGEDGEQGLGRRGALSRME